MTDQPHDGVAASIDATYAIRQPAAELRDLIAADCPHRLVDYDRHLSDRQPTKADIRLWRIEHAISSRPGLEAHLDDLDRHAHDTTSASEAMDCLEQTSRIRHQIAEGLT